MDGFIFFKRYSQVPAKAALQLVRRTQGDPLSHAGGRESEKIGNPIHNVPLNPPLAKQDKEILDAWFYSCKAEKCPENPPSNMQRREEKVENPTKSTHKPPLSQKHPEILGVWFFALSTSDMVQPPPVL